jgi:hypothetical protein
MRETKVKLEDFYGQGVFVMDLDQENSVIEYQLRDKSLLL